MNERHHTIIESEEDTLIARVTSNDALGDDWRRFESIAAAQPASWERLARALRDELAARSAFDQVLTPTDAIALPADSERAARHLRLVQSWPGWALAAVLALAWTVSVFNPPTAQNSANLGGPLVPVRHSADEAFNDYLTLGAQEGRVLQELPMMMVETRFDASERQVEVVYVRQLLERTTVRSAIELTEDPLGRPTVVPVDVSVFTSGKPL